MFNAPKRPHVLHMYHTCNTVFNTDEMNECE